MRNNQLGTDELPADTLLAAYCGGYFPMAESRHGKSFWYSPDPRAIFDLEDFRIPRTIRQALRKKSFTMKINQEFESVILACAERDKTWISDKIVESYLELHRLGYAHSVEAWQEGKLVGGLYGVSIGGAFFGESMFHRNAYSSSAALVFLHKRLVERDFVLHDIQFITPHLARFGAKEISRAEYLELLGSAIRKQCVFI
jgi:leucyl/phenylalanyl-tRNA--protein transferase